MFAIHVRTAAARQTAPASTSLRRDQCKSGDVLPQSGGAGRWVTWPWPPAPEVLIRATGDTRHAMPTHPCGVLVHQPASSAAQGDGMEV